MNEPKVGDVVIANGSHPFTLLRRIPDNMEWVGMFDNGHLCFTRTEYIEKIVEEV